MFLLITSMEFGVVGLLVANHPANDFEQSLSQASQRTGVAHAITTLFLIIRLAPGTGLAEAIGPQMNGMAQKLVAGPADLSFVDLTRFKTDRGRSRDALQDLEAGVATGIR